MANEILSELFANFAFFLEVKNENAFKIKAFQNTARLLEEQSKEASELVASGEIAHIQGIGKGSQALIAEYVKTGQMAEYEALRQEFPGSLLDLLLVRGLGPKKAKALYTTLEISSLAELEYACKENRLLELKGFGAKTQENILKGISEIKSQQGKVLLPVALAECESIREELRAMPGVKEVHLVGEARRELEVISAYEFIVVHGAGSKPSFASRSERGVRIELHLHAEGAPGLGEEIFRRTGSSEFVESALAQEHSKKSQAAREAEFFHEISLPWVSPECREGKAHKEPQNLLEEAQIRGVFHMHTTASDGANSLEEMVQGAIALGFEYIGVSDHSQSAFYAHGLKEPALRQQRAEINRLREKYPELMIFHGIESDILVDGSLDYPEEVLEKFDFVIPSVHGQFQMPREEMTKRICKALENPYTTWLGHMTGRLLLGRAGYALDVEAVLRAAEKFGKGIELNSNPQRLDIDWRFLPEVKARKIPMGIFPDAHSVRGLEDFRYGVLMARKGGLSKEHVSNTMSAKEMAAWLSRSK